MKSMKGLLKTLLWVALVVGGILVIGRFTFYEPVIAMDNTMAPTIWKGDKVLIMTKGKLDKGHIAYCKHPMFEGQYVMGRIVAVPGDTVEIARNQIMINGDQEEVERGETFTYIDRESATQAMEMKFQHATVQIGGRLAKLMYPSRDYKIDMRLVKVKSGYFLMGDNRALEQGAADSRNYGEVHQTLCKGKVLLVWWAKKGLGDPDEINRLLIPHI